MSDDELDDSPIKEVTLEGVTYKLRRRLGWKEQTKIDQSALRLFTNGQSIANLDGNGIEALEEVEIRPDLAKQNELRLQLRLININRNEIDNIPPEHVPVLIELIEGFEKAAKARQDALSNKVNPPPPATAG